MIFCVEFQDRSYLIKSLLSDGGPVVPQKVCYFFVSINTSISLSVSELSVLISLNILRDMKKDNSETVV